MKKCANGHFDRFKAIKTKDLNPNHPLIGVRELVLGIEGLFTRESGAFFGKPTGKDTEAYRCLLTVVRLAQRAIKDFFSAGGFNFSGTVQFPKLPSYLQKIAGVMNDIDKLIGAACAPRCRPLFKSSLKVTALGPQRAEVNAFPPEQTGVGGCTRKGSSTCKLPASTYRRKGPESGHN